jgi:plastocyanin
LFLFMFKNRFSLRNVATIVACLAVVMFSGSEEDDPKDDPAKSGEKAITAFVLTTPPATGVITGTAIAVNVPAGTDVTKLAPVITVSDKATVSPASGAAQDFTNPVKYTVTVEDDTKAEYTVTVTVEKPLGGTAQTGLTYVMLYVDKSGVVKTSAGEVTLSVGDALTLTPASGSAFTVAVTAGGITGITGIVTFTDNTTATGGTLTPLSKDAEIEITEAITEDRVLGVPGMAVKYVWNGNMLAVNSPATLTILPGTTVRFANTLGRQTVRTRRYGQTFGNARNNERTYSVCGL